MAMRSRSESTFVMFDVMYEDGSKSSNRKVPTLALGGLDGDEPARGIIETQDREIGAASGRPRPAVKGLVRSPIRVVEEEPKGKAKPKR